MPPVWKGCAPRHDRGLAAMNPCEPRETSNHALAVHGQLLDAAHRWRGGDALALQHADPARAPLQPAALGVLSGALGQTASRGATVTVDQGMQSLRRSTSVGQVSSRDPLGWVGNTLDDRVAVADLIGEGGFGYVYRGTHLGFDEPVALKCLKIPAQLNEEERATFLHDFRTEARLLHRLSRKTAGIVQALDVGAAVSPKGIWSPYIVMEWLEGQSLENELNTRAVRGLAARTPAEAVALLRPAADALAVAHGSNIAHLDVKPANLFIAEQDGDTTIKVLDFGIARVLTTSNTVSRALTEHGSPAAFTPNYAAPEQFNQRHGRPGAQTDVFALALVVIELVTGQPALDGTTPLQLYVSAANEHFRPSLTAAGVEVGEEVEQALARALAVNPAKRYPDAGSFWTALAAAVEGTVPGLALPPSVQVSVVPAPLQGSRSFQATARAATAYATARPASGQHRVCTVLVAELTGTSALARHLDPELLAEVVDQVFDLLRATVEDAEGTVEEMVGDRLVATFGLHTDSVAAAERAVRAALAMPASLASFALPRGALRGGGPRVRLGLATGRVFLRQDTRSTGRGLTVTGAPLALATRLAQTASSDQVVIGRDAHRQVAGLFDVEAFELSPPDEGETPVKAFRVMAAAGGRAARLGGAGSARAPSPREEQGHRSRKPSNSARRSLPVSRRH